MPGGCIAGCIAEPIPGGPSGPAGGMLLGRDPLIPDIPVPRNGALATFGAGSAIIVFIIPMSAAGCFADTPLSSAPHPRQNL